MAKKYFHYLSDLHVDFYNKDYDLRQPYLSDDLKSDTLIVAGDLSNNVVETAATLIKMKKYYKNVLFVDGNHDHYNHNGRKVSYNTVKENMEYLLDQSKKHGWTYLSYDDFVSDDIAVIGNAGWYDFNAQDSRYTTEDYRLGWTRYIADSRLINFDKNPDVYAEECANQLFDKVSKYNKDPKINHIIIVTHTLPVHSALVIKDENNSSDVAWNLLNGCFYNSHMKKVYLNNECRKISAWIFGHTHFSKEFTEDNVVFACNPRGYPTEESSRGHSAKVLQIG